MILKAMIGTGDTIEAALQQALDGFNVASDTEQREFKQAIYIPESFEGFKVILLYNSRAIIQPEPDDEKHEYIGSTTIDPQDPEWLNKWKAGMFEPAKTVWDKDRFQDASVRLQEAPGATEE